MIEVVCVFALLFCSCNGYPNNNHIYGGEAADTFAQENGYYREMDSAKASAVDQENQVLSYDVQRGMQKETQQDVARINQFSVMRLVGGQDSCEGLLEFQTDRFRQTCDLNFGDAEARVVCRDLGCNSIGAQRADPNRFGFSAAIIFYIRFDLDCTGSESTILNCSRGPAVCVPGSAPHAIAIDCGGNNDDEVRLVGGSNRCEGRLVTLLNGRYGQACDLIAGDRVARVVCRELGCPIAGSQRVDPVQFGFSAFIGIYHVIGPFCLGFESSLSQCLNFRGNCVADSVPHAIAIRCGPASPADIQETLQEN